MGTFPAGWVSAWDDGPSSSSDSIQPLNSAGHLQLHTPTAVNAGVLAKKKDIVSADAELLALIGEGSSASLVLRGQGDSAFGHAAYHFSIKYNESIGFYNESADGSWTQIASSTQGGGWCGQADCPYGADSRYLARFRVEGETLSAKVWPEGSDEPSTWSITAVDSHITTAGFIGIATFGPQPLSVLGLAWVPSSDQLQASGTTSGSTGSSGSTAAASTLTTAYLYLSPPASPPPPSPSPLIPIFSYNETDTSSALTSVFNENGALLAVAIALCVAIVLMMLFFWFQVPIWTRTRNAALDFKIAEKLGYGGLVKPAGAAASAKGAAAKGGPFAMSIPFFSLSGFGRLHVIKSKPPPPAPVVSATLKKQGTGAFADMAATTVSVSDV